MTGLGGKNTKMGTLGKDFRVVTGYASRSSVKKFWLVTLMRLVSTAFDLFALALIWFTVNSISAGEFNRLSIGPFTIIERSPLSEITVVFLGLATMTLFIMKSVVGLFTLKAVRNVAIEFETAIAEKVLNKNLSGVFGGGTLGRDSLPRVQHSISMARNWVSGSVTGLSNLLAEGVLVLSLFVFMIITSPLATLSLLCIIGLTAVFLQGFLRLRIRKTSISQRENTYRWMSGLSSALSIKTHLQVSSSIHGWLEGLSLDVREASKATNHLSFLNSIPRYALEFAVITSVGVVVASSFLVGDFADNAPGAAIVLAGAFRISASLLPMQAALNSINSSRVLSEGIISQLREPEGFSSPKLGVLEPRVLEFIRSKKFKFLIIQGPSGIGKTTALMNLLACLQGSPELEGVKLGYGGQDPAVLSGGLDRNIGLTYSQPDYRLEKPLVELADALNFQNSLSRFVGKGKEDRESVILSGGELTRLEIIRAHANSPDLVILDEPTTGLDPATTERLIMYLNTSPQRYVVVSHDPIFCNQLKDSDIFLIDNPATR